MTTFIFVHDGWSYQYGIGKYISSLKETLAGNEDFDLNVIILGSKNYNEMTVITDHSVFLNQTKNIKLVYFPSMPFGSFEYQHIENARQTVTMLETHFKFDQNTIFHFVSWCGIFIARVIKERYKNPIIFDLHCLEWQFALNGNKKKFAAYWKGLNRDYGNPDSELIKPGAIYEKKLCDIEDHIIVRTNQMKNDVKETYGADKSKISVIYNGITDFGITPGRIKFTKEKYGFGYNEKIILFVGRLCDQKGIQYLIKAFKIVLSSYNHTRLVVVGNGNYDQYLKECNDIWGKVVFTGRLDSERLELFYRVADIGIVPSIYEPFGYVLLEMMYHKIPVISTNIEGPGEIIVDGYNGIKVNVRIDKKGERSILPEELAEKILELIYDERLAKSLAKKALLRLRKRFLSDQMAKSLVKVYEATLSQREHKGKNTQKTIEIEG